MASKGRPLLPLMILLFLFPLFIESRSPPSHRHQPFEFIEKLEGCHKGKTIKGLHKLKQYLEKFGYLPQHHNTITNTTVYKYAIGDKDDDSFDDLLESAIKTYQLNYHLNVTGQLDVATARQMMMPRCGVPDVINGKSSMQPDGKGRHLGSDGHFHAVAHYTFFPNSPRWPPSKTQLTYGFLRGLQVIDMQDLRSITARAFQQWEKVSHFRFQETQNVQSADLKIGFYSRNHGDNAPFDGRGGVLAHAFAPQVGWFHYDADESWSLNPIPNTFDVESIAVHEIGHLLGLGHSNDKNAIMFPSFPANTRKVNLGQDDINGIRALYARNN